GRRCVDGARARMDVARSDVAVDADRAERRRVRAVERRVPNGRRPDAGRRTAAALEPGRDVRARRANGQGIVDERPRHHGVRAGRRPVRSGRSGLCRRRRRHAVRVRYSAGALMMKRMAWLGLAAVAATMIVEARAAAQRGAPAAAPALIDWSTDGGDSQRTGWGRDGERLTPPNVGSLKLQWKRETGNEPRALHALMPVLIAGHVRTSTGEKQLAIVNGISDNIQAFDVETGKTEWRRQWDYSGQVVPGQD